MSKNKFLEDLKVNGKKATKGALIGVAATAALVGYNKTNTEPQTETEMQTSMSPEQKNIIIEKKNKILLEYNDTLDKLKSEIQKGNFDKIEFENKMIRGIQILTALNNNWDIGIDEDDSQYIIPERSPYGGTITGYRIPEDLQDVLSTGAKENTEEYARAVSLSNGELDCEAAEIYNDYVADTYKTDGKRVEAIDRMKEKISKYVKPKIKLRNDGAR